MEERYIADDKNLHDDEFLSGLKDHVFQLSVDHTHIAELADDGSQGGFETAVMLTCNEGIAPLGIYSVVNPAFQIMESRRYIRVY